MKIYFFLLILYFQYVESNFTIAELGTVYSGTVKNGIEDIYFFNLTESRDHNNGVSE